MLFLVVITAFLCCSTIRADPSISFTYPAGIPESACSNGISWTKWFDESKPSDNGDLDQELLPVIQAANGRDVCQQPLAIQVQSFSEIPSTTPVSGRWYVMNNIVAGFISGTPGLDFQVRFCCANTEFDPTTTTTTTPRPITNGTCGRAEITNSFSRIFGGSHAIPNSWPWQVLYEEKKDCGNNQICLGLCGGTLIDERHVLTAAHCIGTTDPSLITITAGLHNKYAYEGDKRQVLTVERIFKHPNYNEAINQNDLTILRLAKPVQFNKYVQPACLPGPDPQPDADVVLIGWGKTDVSGEAYHILKQTKVKVIGECNRYWGGRVNEEKQICVGDLNSRDSACQGDSGGPMLYEHDGQWVVAGVTSFGSSTSCSVGSAFMPNVYVRVSAYLPWINSII